MTYQGLDDVQYQLKEWDNLDRQFDVLDIVFHHFICCSKFPLLCFRWLGFVIQNYYYDLIVNFLYTNTATLQPHYRKKTVISVSNIFSLTSRVPKPLFFHSIIAEYLCIVFSIIYILNLFTYTFLYFVFNFLFASQFCAGSFSTSSNPLLVGLPTPSLKLIPHSISSFGFSHPLVDQPLHSSYFDGTYNVILRYITVQSPYLL